MDKILKNILKSSQKFQHSNSIAFQILNFFLLKNWEELKKTSISQEWAGFVKLWNYHLNHEGNWKKESRAFSDILSTARDLEIHDFKSFRAA